MAMQLHRDDVLHDDANIVTTKHRDDSNMLMPSSVQSTSGTERGWCKSCTSCN